MMHAGHLLLIEETLSANFSDVMEYIASISCASYPIFSSLDIRNSGFKIAHVDANLFPAGFNNLSGTGKDLLAKNVAKYLGKHFTDAKNILIYVENFTRNLKYIESINVIKESIENAGCNVRFGIADLEEDRVLDDGTIIHKLVLKNGALCTLDGFVPDVIILNNDLTAGTPELLLSSKQRVVPSYTLGWHSRSKANHFRIFNTIMDDFCSKFALDPWLLSTYFEDCDNVDFKTKTGLECLAKKVDGLLARIKTKYSEYNIQSEPYLFVKADKGTFGMGIMTVKSGNDIVNINKKSRHSMQVIKQGRVNEHLLIQEGIPTIERAREHSAETMAYMCNNECLEMFYRYNTEKDTFSNLNSSGMHFTEGADEHLKVTKLVISKIAGIASMRE